MSTQVEAAPAVANKTCKIVIVSSGMPNAGIRVYPAEHEFEKIDTGNRPGIERWETVRQLMRRFCPPGKYVPEPMSFNPNHPKDPHTAPPADSELPLATLEGAFLEAPPNVKRPSLSTVQAKEAAAESRIQRLEAGQKETNARLDKILEIMAAQVPQSQQPEKRSVGRPRKEDK